MAGTPPGTVPALFYQYTTEAEIASLVGQEGVMLRTSDDRSTQQPTDLLEDVIDEASEVVDEYLLWRYKPELMVNSRWVRRRCSIIAAHILSNRRGNPDQFVERHEKVIEEFERVRKGLFHIPNLAPRNQSTLPHVDNIVVDYRRRPFGKRNPIMNRPYPQRKWPDPT